MMRLSRRNKLVAFIVLVLVIAIAGGVLYILLVANKNDASQSNGEPTISAKEQAIGEVKRKEATAPKDNESEQVKADYYLGLSSAQAGAEDYKASIDSFEKAVAYDDNINYVQYMNAAEIYAQLGSKSKANEMLDKAVVSVNAQIQDESERKESLADIETLRQELMK